MYDVVLTRLAPDGHSAADSFARTERDGLTAPELRILLESFCAVAAVENAVVAPEIQVKTGAQRFLIRTGQKKLMLYDAVHRELPALVLGVDEAMAELDGTALAGREAAVRQHEAAARAQAAAPPPPVPPAGGAGKPRLVAMGVAAAALLGLLVFWRVAQRPAGLPAGFQAVKPAESAGLQAALVGVYLTGNQPGQHGIVFNSTADVKLFELMALAPPHVVHASGRLGRVGTKLVLATDQPGGAIEITNHDALTYGGEVYRRIP